MDKRKQWVALTALAVLAVLAGGWFLLVSPKRAEAADLRSQAADQEVSNSQLRTKVRMLAKQAEKLPEQQAKIAAVAVKLPAGLDQAELLRSLSAAATATGVDLVTVSPGAEAAVAAAAGKPVEGSAGALLAQPVAITVNGSYSGLQRFTGALEDLPRAVRVTGLSVVPGVSATTGGATAASADRLLTDGDHLTGSITADVYVAAGAAPLAPVVAPAAPAK